MANELFLFLPIEVLDEYFILNDGIKFPKITLGLSQTEGYAEIYKAIDVALDVGYRSFDCSPHLSVEENFGKALQVLLPKYDLERKDVIIASKICPMDYGADSTKEAFWRSCQNLRTSYIDIFLMQWPGGHNINSEDEESTDLRVETWIEIVDLYYDGAIKSPGVCHFTKKHLESLQGCTNKMPVINQVEFHPRHPQVETLEYCSNNDILLQACSFKESVHPLVLNDRIVKEVADTVERSPTEVILKWIINKNVAVISQSQYTINITRNFHLFDFVLEKPEMDKISSIEIREKYLRNPIIVC